MKLLTASALKTLVGKTIYWEMKDGPDGIMTILSYIDQELKTQTINGADFELAYLDKAVYKSYGRFIKL